LLQGNLQFNLKYVYRFQLEINITDCEEPGPKAFKPTGLICV
jgi:hypothetical protein